MSHYKELSKKYDHALKQMWDMFVFGRVREEELEQALELVRDELKRIRVICKKADDSLEHCAALLSEAHEVCERGLADSQI